MRSDRTPNSGTVNKARQLAIRIASVSVVLGSPKPLVPYEREKIAVR